MYNEPTNIFDLTRTCKNDFLYNQIEVVPGYMFSQYQTIKKCHLYYNSHYVEGDYEEVNGVLRKKPFYNINKWRCDIATKQIDLDTKDLVLVSTSMEHDWNVFLLERELKVWLKRSKMANILNEISEKLPKYGSVVLRKVKGGAEVIDLRRFMIEQSASSLKKASYKILMHYMTPSELRKKKKIWTATKNGVDEVISKFVSNAPQESYLDAGGVNISVGTPYAEIFEIYTEVPKSWITDKKEDEKEWVYSHFILAGCDSFWTNSTGAVQNDGIVLFKEELKIEDDPFKEIHLNRTEGRWLGQGVIEDTFEAQRQRNRAAIFEDKGMELATLILLQTANKMVQSNIISDMENGEIITGKEPINRVDTRMHGLAELNAMKADYERLADKMSFSSDILSGEIPPASATATATVNAVQQAASTFDFKKENYGIFFEDFVNDLVFPEIEKDLMKPHKFRFEGSASDHAKLKKYLLDAAVSRAAREYFKETGNQYSETELLRIRESISTRLAKDQRQVWIDTQEDFFKNLDYYVDIVVTSEKRNLQVQLQNLQQVLTIISGNPTILQDPVFRRLLFKMMSLLGLHMAEIEQIEQDVISQQGQSSVPVLNNLASGGGSRQAPQPGGNLNALI